MTSRERFRCTLNHKEADRVPIDIGQDMHNGIHEIAYKNLLKHLGEEHDVVFYDQMQHLAVCKESILKRLHSDTRYFFADGAEGAKFETDKDGNWIDEWGVVRKNSGFYHDSIGYPLSDFSLDKLKNYQLPNPTDPHRFKNLRKKAEALTNETDYAVIGANACSLFFLTSELTGFQEFMEKILTDQDDMIRLLDKILEWQMLFFEKYLDEVGDLTEMVWMGDDWGTQIGPIVNPLLFKEIFKPRYKEFTTMVKSKTNAKIALHSCGSILWALEDLIEVGIEVVHPIQGDAVEMDRPEEIKMQYGDRLTFYSNLKNQTVIPYGSTQDVEEDVKQKIKALAPGGGFIMSGGHNIQADVPPENLLALIDTTLKYANYPIK